MIFSKEELVELMDREDILSEQEKRTLKCGSCRLDGSKGYL